MRPALRPVGIGRNLCPPEAWRPPDDPPLVSCCSSTPAILFAAPNAKAAETVKIGVLLPLTGNSGGLGRGGEGGGRGRRRYHQHRPSRVEGPDGRHRPRPSRTGRGEKSSRCSSITAATLGGAISGTAADHQRQGRGLVRLVSLLDGDDRDGGGGTLWRALVVKRFGRGQHYRARLQVHLPW